MSGRRVHPLGKVEVEARLAASSWSAYASDFRKLVSPHVDVSNDRPRNLLAVDLNRTILMSQPDLNPYRSSEVLAESTPPIEFEPIRPSFRAFLNAAIVLLIVAVLFWAVVTGFVIQSNDRAAHFISGLLHWLIASIGFGGCVALFPHLSPLRLARFRAGHYLAPFVGIVAASVPVFRLSMFSERTFLMFLTFILGA